MRVFDADSNKWVSEPSEGLDFLEDYVDWYKVLSRRDGREKSVAKIIGSRKFTLSVNDSKIDFFARLSIYKSLANCIVFSSGERVVLLLQFRSFCDGFILPESSTYVGRNQQSCIKRAEILLRVYEEKCSQLRLEDFGESIINGWICNQTMPYHFFYDHAPYVEEYLGGSSLRERVITTEKGCFSDINAYAKNHSVEILKHVPEVTKPGGFNVLIARDNFPGRVDHDNILKNFDSMFFILSQEKYGSFCDWQLGKGSIKFWVFDTGSKRKWLNRERFLERLEVFFREKFPGVEFLIVNDGMTRPYYLHEKKIWNIQRLESCEDVSYLDFGGFDYHFKCMLASSCDVFVTDAATSSIIPARFLKRKTLCVVSDGGDRADKGHIHHDSDFIPAISRTYEDVSWILDPFYVDFDKVEPYIEDAVNETLRYKS